MKCVSRFLEKCAKCLVQPTGRNGVGPIDPGEQRGIYRIGKWVWIKIPMLQVLSKKDQVLLRYGYRPPFGTFP